MLEMVVSVFGFCLGACYWSFNYTNPVLGLIWASLHIVISGLLVGFGIVKGVSRQSTILLSILVIGCLLFISLLIGFTSSIIGSIIFAVCVVLASVCLIPLYYLARYGYIPLHGKLIPGVTMTIAVVGLTVSGFILQVASNMILFTLLMGFIFLVLFCTASSIAYQK